MNAYWEKFIQLHKGEYFARDAFDDLCLDILNYHYPGRKIIPSDNLDNCDKNKLNVVFLSKFFTDQLTNSRKGQIRKAFKEFLDFVLKNKIKIYAWVLCVPYSLSDDEMKWWINWKNKMTSQYTLNIQFFDGAYIIELAKKYDLFDKWFKQNKNIIQEEKNENKSFELITDKKIPENNITENNSTQNNDIEKNNTSKLNKNTNTEPRYAEKIDYSYLEKEFLRIKNLYQKFSEKQRKKLEEKNSIKNIDNLFDEIKDLKKIQNDPLKLYYKAKSSQVHNLCPQAVKTFELILSNDEFINKLINRKDDIQKSILECKQKVQATLLELEADVYYIQKDYKKAYESYKKALNFDKKNKNIEKKLFESKGDLYLKQSESEDNYQTFNDAFHFFDKAYGIDKNDEAIKNKRSYTYWLKKGKKFFSVPILNIFNIFLNPIGYWRAFSIFPNENTKEKLKKSSKKAYFAAAITILAIFIGLLLFSIKNIKPEHQNKSLNSIKNKSLKALSISQIAEQKADKIIKNISYDKIHLIDTALNDYKRAILYGKASKKLKEKYNKALKYKLVYISKAQTNIKKNKKKYFVSMRRFSEGLKLFKYIYDPQHPSKGKYGYVDSAMNIIIPPLYDFNYNKMYKGTENFHNGKALVCLKQHKNKILYFLINKKNKIIKIF